VTDQAVTGPIAHADSQTPLAISRRLRIALGVGLIASALVIVGALHFPEFTSDFDQIWYAARAVLHGRDPYQLIGPGREFDVEFPLYYPLMAPLVTLPFGLLPVIAARAAFVFTTCGLLTFLLTRDGYRRLPIVISGAFVSNIQLVQWSPIMTCAVLVPALGFFVAAKPNIGPAAMAGLRTGREFVLSGAGVVLLTLIAFLVQPSWFNEWRGEVASATHFRSFLMLPGGQLLALCALRWRRWDARLLGALALFPQTPGANSALLLLLIPRRRFDILVFSLLTYVPVYVGFWAAHRPTVQEYSRVMAWVTLISVYLPMLWFVLRQPNVGRMPQSVERAVSWLPPWIRGTPTAGESMVGAGR
jgi:hypothetical protein